MDQRISRPVARTTGLLYLALGITGMAGFLLVRPLVFDPTDAATTATLLVEHELLARIGIALELALVVSQALAALWFVRLFRPVEPFAAAAVGVLGMMNAVAILGSTAALGTALGTALAGDPAGPQQMFLLSENLWLAGAAFFGLWLIPMGRLVLLSGLPRALGWFLLVGGVGYLLQSFLLVLAPDAGLVADVLVLPATVGELWMIGLLLWIGFRRDRSRTDVAEEPALRP
ncbi:DUF4386 domain-containing protein [Isoptericola sediminis]|uniref:DUF4386 domain-containing protein n=1 Tax=Isoptericola sediminis TaxID=2733572 RepID=A0A849K6S2_9MICO|nr:DUF4386 domain-containing protein [Isoptericola sediminis]NNU27719.1 DUF4386 domain-containing protein [Isoptericola sediminis]